MPELPNAVTYVVIAALIVSGVSAIVAWQPFNRVTAFAVADVRSCDEARCNSYDVNFCDGPRLRHADYECQQGECRLAGERTVSYCDIACIEPENGPAHCALRRLG